MMSDDWVIQGSRPPSVADNRPKSTTFKHFGYRMVDSSSPVDESLFRSHHQGRLSGRVNFQPPWDSTKKFDSQKIIVKKKKKDRPLFWSPTPNSSCENFVMLKKGSGLRTEIFRRQKHTPTFCDESLFGLKNQFEEPTFDAPWDCPVKDNMIYKDLNGNSVSNINSNNWKKIKLRNRPSTAPSQKSNARPLWKP
ncbi:RBPJ-interacting and tubulin-associated protein 1 [Patella vulgata]|uniref:RBPJ-interacting and tubulin-associated protein 1 n=1 Tax=Patella vulgata TaxID=6465 RepID=UPI00217F399D|nr:RBPJ-interacting and tubulin-associated protein 1 [Patella vulgata]